MNPPILIAEDDEAILEVMTIILEGEGHKIAIAKSAEEIFTVVADIIPCMLFLDISLGGSDGRDITKRLKSRDDTKMMPVIISSANADTVEIAKEVGADDVLIKPFEIDELLGIVQKYTTSERS